MALVPALVAALLTASVCSAQSPAPHQAPRPRDARPPEAPACWSGVTELKNRDHARRPVPRLPVKLTTAPVLRRAVSLKLCVDESGGVTRALVLASSGNADVDTFYREAVLTWKFKPLKRDGKYIPSVASVTFHWEIE